ncbi:MAG: YcnI family protein [Hyphomonadaceae bacterium]|nr:YcnI family protein [Hyphomonadaceae bacterium]
MQRALLALGLAAALLAHAASAAAHVVFAEPQAQGGAYYAGFLRVSHGCGTSPTISVRVDIPPGVLMARPQPKPGWRLSVAREPLAEPIPSEGGSITERVVSITWRGRLPADQFDQFGVMMKLPAQAGPLYFFVTQTCARGERSWSQVPAEGQPWGSVESPAPVLTLAAPQGAAPETSHDHRH